MPGPRPESWEDPGSQSLSILGLAGEDGSEPRVKLI